MVPIQQLLCPLTMIGIGGIYAAWNRFRISRPAKGHVLRDRVAYMLWVTANRA